MAISATAERASDELEELEPLLGLADAVETLARALNEVIRALEIPAEREQRLSHASATIMPLLGLSEAENPRIR